MISQWQWRVEVDPQLKEDELVIRCQNQVLAQEITQVLSEQEAKPLTHWPIKVTDGIEIIDPDQLVYLEVDQGLLKIQTKTGTHETRMSLKEALSQLAKPNLIQISKYAALNVDYLERLEVAFSGSMYAHLTNGQRVIVSRRFVQALKAYLHL